MQYRKSILFLSLIGLMVLSSSAFALQSGDFTYTFSSQADELTPTTTTTIHTTTTTTIQKSGDFYYTESGGTITITRYTGTGGNVVIPTDIEGMPVVSIGGSAFYYCIGLTSVTIPSSVTSIGGYAFHYCSGLTSIVVDASNTIYSSQDGVLYNKDMTVLIQYPGGRYGVFTIPNSVTSIGWQAFYGCTGLTSVTIPDSVTSIGDYAFRGCTGLTSVTIGSSVTSIGAGAFANCTGLTSAYFYGNAPSMGQGVFSGCSSNFTVYFTAGSTGFTISTWDGYPATLYGETTTTTIQFTGTVSRGTITITRYTGTGGNVVIPTDIEGMPVVSIGGQAFDGCSGLTSVTIPNSVTSIGNYAFRGCTGLTSVTIPNSVTSIGSHAFGYCTGLTSVTIPNSVTSIGDMAFVYCVNLTSVTIPNSVTSIGWYAFYYCSGLTSIVVDASNTIYSSQDGVLYNKDMTVLIQYPGGRYGVFTIPNSVTYIEFYAFANCSGLTSMTIPDSVTSIGGWAFQGCTGLTSVTIGSSVTSIEEEAFAGCTGLTSVTIGSSVTYIGDYAFANCSSLTSVTIPNSVTSIGWYVFFGCPRLRRVTIGSSVTSIGNNAFAGCSGLTSVTIPNSVTSIGDGAFANCTGLTSIVVDASNTSYSSQNSVVYNKAKTVHIQYLSGTYGVFTIPNSVTYIGAEAFYGCTGLTSVTIGNSVTTIGNNAFANCSGLTSAYFYGNAPSMGASVFDACASNFTVCYTVGSTGFTTPTWYGYPAAQCAETTSSTTTVPATVITLASLTAKPFNGGVILEWKTETEIDNAGFNLYRSETEDGEDTKINTELIPAQGSPTQGASYEFIDNDVQNRKTYYYKLEDIDLNGKSTMHGSVSATPRMIYGMK